MHVCGGSMTDTKVNYEGHVYVSEGGTANDTTVTRGGMYIFEGGTANDTMVSSGGHVVVSGGGTATSTVVNFWGSMRVSSGGIVTDTTVSSGSQMLVSGGGTMIGTTVMSGGRLNNFVIQTDTYYTQGICISNAVVAAQGTTYHAYLYDGQTATNTMVDTGGWMYVSGGGTATGTTVNGLGGVQVFSGGTAINTMVSSGSWLSVYSSGIAIETTVMSGGRLNGFWVQSDNHFVRGIHISNAIISSGGAGHLYDGQTATGTTVSSGGQMMVSGGGTATDTIVSSGGRVFVSSGGVHRGMINLALGAVVSAYSGAVIDFTLNGRTSQSDYLINDLSLISGSPTYTITVSVNQSPGTYKLAQGAENFNSIIIVGDGTSAYGELSVNTSGILYGDYKYCLVKLDGNLYLTFGVPESLKPEKPIITVSTTVPTNRNVTVTATFSDDTATKQYSFNGADWLTYSSGVEFSTNGKVYFRGIDATGNISEIAE